MNLILIPLTLTLSPRGRECFFLPFRDTLGGRGEVFLGFCDTLCKGED